MSARDEYSAAKEAAWTAFVNLAWRSPAPHTLTKAEQRKVKAVVGARESGMSREEVIAAGQSEILSRDARKRKDHSEPQRVLSWRVSRSLADAIMTSNASPDAEEALVSRLVRVCHLRTSDDFWEFVNSTYADLSDKELRNLAGVVLERRKNKKT